MSKLLIFDCDGVLVDTEAMISRSRLNILNALGFPVTLADTTALRGLSSNDAYGRIAEQFGKPMPADIRDQFRAEFRTQLGQGLPPTPGVVDLIGALTVPFCVASNGAHRFMEMTLGAAGLIERFTGRLFSADDVPRPKPHPDLFLHAAAHMQTVPADCFVIEDSVHGVTAGVAARMHVVGFGGDGAHGGSLLAAGARIVCADMDAVARYFANQGYVR